MSAPRDSFTSDELRDAVDALQDDLADAMRDGSTLRAQLAASEAREVTLREAVTALLDRYGPAETWEVDDGREEWSTAEAALAAPQDTTALREFDTNASKSLKGMMNSRSRLRSRVARAYQHLEVVTPEEAVDAVLSENGVQR